MLVNSSARVFFSFWNLNRALHDDVGERLAYHCFVARAASCVITTYHHHVLKDAPTIDFFAPYLLRVHRGVWYGIAVYTEE